MAPQKENQHIHINQSSTGISENQGRGDIKGALTAVRKFLHAMLILVILMISLAAIVLSTVSYNASDSKKVDFKTKGENVSNVLVQINSYKTDMESKLMQLNSTLLLLEQNETQSNIDTTLLISQVMHNISQLCEQHNATNNNITSLANTIELLGSLSIIERAKSTRLHCGAGEWYRVAYLNMSDCSQWCPSAWREYGTGNIRVCGRANSTVGSCSPVSFSTIGGPYSRVCGRVIGYQVGSPDGFRKLRKIDNVKFDGINIIHGL